MSEKSTNIYLKLTKMTCFSYCLLYVFSSTKLENKRAEQVLPGDGRGRGQVAQIMYTRVNKCKNVKIK
jgi:hypothetical protein